MKRKIASLVVLVSGIVAFTPQAWAVNEGLQAQAKTWQNPKSADEAYQVRQISERFGVSQFLVRQLRKEPMSWEDIRNLLLIAAHSRRMIEDVLVLRRDGFEWETIAQHYGLSLKEIRRAS